MKIFEYGDPGAKNVLLQPVDDRDLGMMENEVRLIGESTDVKFRLLALKTDDWNRDLSPWEAPPVFGSESFGGGAERTLSGILSVCRDDGKNYYIGGYSLAGLFALWSVYRTGLFRGAAAASPSVWFPGFTDYMRSGSVRTEAVFLSLGDREEKTRNPVMATVGARIREVHALLTEQGVDAVLRWNPGNHFRDPDARTAEAFAWILDRGAE